MYDLTVSGGDLAGLNGTVGIDLAVGQDITNMASDALPAGEPGTDETYTVINTINPPTGIELLLSVDPNGDGITSANNTPGNELRFNITGLVDGAEVTLFADGVPVGQAITAGNDLVIITDGLTPLADGVHQFNAQQILRNIPGDVASGLSAPLAVTIDTANPVVISFTRQDPAASPTGADVLVFRAAFNEDVENVDATDFSVNSTSTAGITGVALIAADVYDVTVSGGDLDGFVGTVGIDLTGGQNIIDLAGNALPAGEPANDETYAMVIEPVYGGGGPTVGGQVMLVNKFELLMQYIVLPMRLIMGFAF